jgi:hypothetical protein
MSQPEYEPIVGEIRSARIVVSPELRTRVRGLAAAPPPAAPRRELPWRRLTLVLIPACLVLALAGALAAGLATSGKPERTRLSAAGRPIREAAPSRPVFSTATEPADSAQTLQPEVLHGVASGAGGAAPLPVTPGRAQRYEAELTLRVKDLSSVTKRALRLTRAFHGYVRSVDYGSGADRGIATLVLRVPVGSVQAAIVRFSALGTILDQHVSIQDVQPQLDQRFRRMQALRDVIANLQAKLESPNLSPAERAGLEAELVAARRRLLVLERVQAQQRRQTSYATVALDLRTATRAVAAPPEPGRIGRALHRSGSILLDEMKVLVYVLIVGAPLLALAGLAAGAARIRRRRTEARLLSTS